MLYNIIQVSVFDDSGSGLQLLPRIETKAPEFWTKAVKHLDLIAWGLWVKKPKVWSKDQLERALRVCTGVDNLLLVADLAHADVFQLPLLPMLSDMRPTRLFIMAQLGHLDFDSSFLRAVGHLIIGEIDRDSILGTSLSADWRYWPAISRFPAPTHLALAHAAPPNQVHAILAATPHLVMLLIMAEDEGAAVVFSAQLVLHDDHIVIVGPGTVENVDARAGTRAINELWA